MFNFGGYNNGCGGNSWECIIFLIIVLVVLEFLTSIIGNNNCNCTC